MPDAATVSTTTTASEILPDCMPAAAAAEAGTSASNVSSEPISSINTGDIADEKSILDFRKFMSDDSAVVNAMCHLIAPATALAALEATLTD